MKKLVAFLMIFSSTLFAFDTHTTFENSNFTLSLPLQADKEHTSYNYNRFRIRSDIYQDNFFLTAIGDVENFLGKEYTHSSLYLNSKTSTDTPFDTQAKLSSYKDGELYAKLYRAYIGYMDEKHHLSFGLQRLALGVGRIWNPTDLFNPKNPLALEVDEVYGVFSLSYTYTINNLSNITAIIAQKEDKKFKYASRLKGYLDVADVAISVIEDETSSMLGYELEGELFESGIELRSEGGWFRDKESNEDEFKALFGFEYAFENSLTLTSEWLHSEQNYIGTSLSYEIYALTYGTLLGIINSEDNSFYLSPSFRYSLADDMSISLGAMIFRGNDTSEFGSLGERYFVNFKVTF